MILIEMEEDNGMSRPVSLQIEDKLYKYEDGNEEYFKLLAGFQNYLVKWRRIDTNGTLIKESNRKILNVSCDHKNRWTIELE